jgi:hypothetical protein
MNRNAMGNTAVAPTSSGNRLPGGVGCNSSELWGSALKFANWLDASGYASYDGYDFMGSPYGRAAKRLYYQKNPLGYVLTAQVVGMEILCPSMRALFVKKQRYVTAEGQLVMAFLNLYEAARNRQGERLASTNGQQEQSAASWLDKAKNLGDELPAQSVPGFHGMCWGYPIDWQSMNGFIPKGTPVITSTPYAYEAFALLYDATGDPRYLELARSVATFVSQDLNDTPMGENAAASSYTPYDHGKVVNANAYRAFVLIDAAERFQDEKLLAQGVKNVNFILQSQDPEGSWLYAIDNPKEAFIDHFHTCFVMKNLHKINRHLQREDVREAVIRGYHWYRKALFDQHDNPKTYAIAPRMEIVRLEMYNIAEAITLGVLLRDEIPEAFALAATLGERLVRQYQLPAGHWITRIYKGGWRHTFPYLRWPQAQLFYALTNLLLATE